jgi:hypothetical protein
VEVGLNPPQAELPQVTFQVTPLLALSLVTTAVSELVAPALMEAGAAGVKVTAMTGAVMEMVAVADLVVSEVEVAVTVTEVGAVGAVKVVAAPLAVEVGLNEPQGVVAQVTVQVTPVLLLTVAVRDAVAPVVREVGCPLMETVTAAGGGVELLPPHAVRPRVAAAMTERRMPWREFIAHLRICRLQDGLSETLLTGR